MKRPLVTRKTHVDTVSGEVPDLCISLAGNSIERVMSHYGYVLAIKSKKQMLGKIVGDTFVPLGEGELSMYAKRGRAADMHPDAERWKERIVEEFKMSAHEVSCIFLVPHRSENFFIGLEQLALAKAGKSGRDIGMIKAHFAPDLALVVDELIANSGNVIRVDSLYGNFVTSEEHTE